MAKTLLNLVTTVFKLIVNMNMHHVPICIVYKEKEKIATFGTFHMREYMDNLVRNDANLWTAVEEDEEGLNAAKDYDYYPVEAGSAHRIVVEGLAPSLLPFPLDYMTFEELSDWLSKYIINLYIWSTIVESVQKNAK